MLLGYRNIDTGHLIENLVYLELRRRKYKIYTGKNLTQEIDFVAENENTKLYIQVAENVKEKSTLERELNAFKNIPDSYPKILMTMDKNLNTDFNGIQHINVLEWLRESLV